MEVLSTSLFFDEKLLKINEDVLKMLQEVLRMPFTQRRIEEENTETDEGTELQFALAQIIEYESLLNQCQGALKNTVGGIALAHTRVDALIQDLVNEKEHETQLLNQKCEQFREVIQGLQVKNQELVGHLQELEKHHDHEKRRHSILESHIVQLNQAVQSTQVQQYECLFLFYCFDTLPEQFVDCVTQYLFDQEETRERQASVHHLRVESEQHVLKQQEELKRCKNEISLLNDLNCQLEESITNLQRDNEQLCQEQAQMAKHNNELQLEISSLKSTILVMLEEKADLSDHSECGYSTNRLHDDRLHVQRSRSSSSTFTAAAGATNTIMSSTATAAATAAPPALAFRPSSLLEDVMSAQKQRDIFSSPGLYNHSVGSLEEQSGGASGVGANGNQNSNSYGGNGKSMTIQSDRQFKFALQLTDLKKNDSFFEGFNQSHRRSTDSQRSLNLISLMNPVEIHQSPPYAEPFMNVGNASLQEFKQEEETDDRMQSPIRTNGGEYLKRNQLHHRDLSVIPTNASDSKEYSTPASARRASKEKGYESNTNGCSETPRDERPCKKCKREFQDPYKVFYVLTCQTAKMNSLYRDDVLEINVKEFYESVKTEVPINQVSIHSFA